MMFERLEAVPRLLMEADLSPVQGSRFQPTGFADLGAATYQLPDGTTKLLVESVQSMANRLEESIVTEDGEVIPELKGLSYIRVNLEGDTHAKTTSLIEAHRINSPYILLEEFEKKFVKEAEYSRGALVDWRKVARTLFKYDVNTLIHGVFMANVEDGRIKIARALSSFIEATGVSEVVSGGVKNNLLDPQGLLRTAAKAKDVYGNVPYSRMEYSASAITAFFNLDLQQIRAYGLGGKAENLLIALALLKVRRFLNYGLRLRTACDFKLDGVRVTNPIGFSLPSEEELLAAVSTGISECRHLFAEPAVTEMTTPLKLTRKEQ